MATRRLTKFDGTLKGRTFTDAYGVKLIRVHKRIECSDRKACAIHNPSDHAMRKFKIKWRIPGPFDIKPLHLERICPHGVGHPDPDNAAFHRANGSSVDVHGCDGCCSPGGYEALQGGTA